MIHAKKVLGRKTGAKKTVAKVFTKTAWDLMGKEKGGWEIVSEKEFQKINPSKKKGIVQPVPESENTNTGEDTDGTDADADTTEPPKVEGIADITIVDVIVELKKLNSIEEIDAYIGDDKRKGVLSAVASRKEKLEAK